MNEKKEDDEFTLWFSSYGLITAERILAKYTIQLAHNDLFAAVKNPNSLFYKFLRVPIKHVLNGIILNQAKEYHIYVQKLFIDYLLSGESSKDEQSSGGQTRIEIEEKRVELLGLGDRLQAGEREHLQLISESQKYLLSFAKKWANSMLKMNEITARKLKEQDVYKSESDIGQAILHALANSKSQDNSEAIPLDFIQYFTKELNIQSTLSDPDEFIDLFSDFFAEFNNIDEQTKPYLDKASVMMETLRQLRGQFYNTILQVTTMLGNLSDYKLNDEQIKINKQALNFDKDLV